MIVSPKDNLSINFGMWGSVKMIWLRCNRLFSGHHELV